jgi:hypothetical protein
VTAADLSKRILEVDPALYASFTSLRGLRGLLDCGCREWKDTSLEVKLEMLQALGRHGISLGVVADATVELLIQCGYQNITAQGDVADTLALLLEHALRGRP